MKPTQKLHHDGQSLWLDNITRDLLESGTLRSYIDDLGITGLTSNPTIFDRAFQSTSAYDAGIAEAGWRGLDEEEIFFELALEDLRAAADLFQPIWERTHGVDGWVSLEVSPRIAYDPKSTLKAAVDLHAKADRPNLFIKIPATAEGIPAIEEAIFAGVPVNVTLLFSREQYLAAAEAYLRGIERRVDAGLDPSSARSPRCSSVAGIPRTSRPSGRTTCTISSGSRWPSRPTGPIAASSAPTGGAGSRTRARGRRGCSRRAPARRI